MEVNQTSFPKKLYSCWHPVGYSDEILKDSPFGTFLLDEAIVLWRTSDGKAHAMKDLCIHRGTALSLGWIKDDCIVCPYHAWRYDKHGECILIPQAPNTKIPSKAKTPIYNCIEKYGIVWVAINKPTYNLPSIDEFNNKQWQFINTGP